MSQTQAHTDIMTVIKRIQQEHTGYPLFVQGDNGAAPDAATQVNPYLKVEIDYLPGGGQLDLGGRPWVRQWGQLCLYAIVRSGQGSLAARQLIDKVLPYFELQQVGIVHFEAGQATKAVTRDGLEHFPALLTFWYDRLSK